MNLRIDIINVINNTYPHYKYTKYIFCDFILYIFNKKYNNYKISIYLLLIKLYSLNMCCYGLKIVIKNASVINIKIYAFM